MQQSDDPYTVVVGVDYSETGALALEQALELASAHARAALHAINVVHPLNQADVLGYWSSSMPTLSIGQAETDLKEYVEEGIIAFRLKHGPSARTPDAVHCHLRLELPAQEIAQLASDVEADVVVIGTHGRRGLTRILIGSVAEGVVRLAPCPVLVVRPKRLVETPQIYPPCPECVKTRRTTHGVNIWCEAHRAYFGQRPRPAATAAPQARR